MEQTNISNIMRHFAYQLVEYAISKIENNYNNNINKNLSLIKNQSTTNTNRSLTKIRTYPDPDNSQFLVVDFGNGITCKRLRDDSTMIKNPIKLKTYTKEERKTMAINFSKHMNQAMSIFRKTPLNKKFDYDKNGIYYDKINNSSKEFENYNCKDKKTYKYSNKNINQLNKKKYEIVSCSQKRKRKIVEKLNKKF